MQIKKDDIKEQILAAAQREFIVHGYEGSSMRLIAKKANTTLGNIYHYYENKEAILEEVLREPLEGLERLAAGHLSEREAVGNMDDFVREWKMFEEIGSYRDLEQLMDERILILFDLRTTRFMEPKERFLKSIKEHMAWHMGLGDGKSVYLDIIINMFISCLRQVIIEYQDPEKAMQEFLKVFKMLCTGMIIHEEKEGRPE